MEISNDICISCILKENLEIHSDLLLEALHFFSQGSYDAAVFQAFKQVEVNVRKAGYYADADYGIDLMRKAFHVDNGNLTDQTQQKSEKQARSDLFAGAIGSYKNPSSHRYIKITAEEAAEAIILANHLLRIVDSRQPIDWKERFADGFLRHLKDRESPLMDPEVFMGEYARGYPVYITFNIGKIENLDMKDSNAFWLAVSTAHSRRIYLKLHMNDSNCFLLLKSARAEIEREFGDQLKWESHGPGQYIRIGVDLEVSPLDENGRQWDQHFKDMREKLEKLSKAFLPYMETCSKADIRF